MRLILAAGTTETAGIEGISAAGADPEVRVHTPSADAEIVAYGEPIRAPVVPVSPTGCPTPAVVTRAVRDLVRFDLTTVDAGLAEPTGAPTVTVGARPGRDVRETDPLRTAHGVFAAAREFGRALPDDELLLGETIPGGTTTALAVLTALGEDVGTSSSLPDNPVERKRSVVEAALAASDAAPGAFAGDPFEALRRVGDPVLATLSGVVAGAAEADTAVTLAGGTQLLAVAALVRHYTSADAHAPRLELATTRYVADDPAVDLTAAADRLDLSLTVTDPGFEDADHPGLRRYADGEAKEGVGMGGALALAERTGLPMARVRERAATVADRLLDDPGETADTGGSSA